jgi:hypothetical protein
MQDGNNHATWIWYPGDWEIWLGNRFNNRRTERGAMFPPFWKQDSHWATVEFSTVVNLKKAETITIAAEGRYNFMLDGKLRFGEPQQFEIPAGEHKINIKVWNQATPPTLFVEGETIQTGSSWLATYEDKIWIDENGVAHGSGIYVPAGCWNFNSIEQKPSEWQLARKRIKAVDIKKGHDGSLLVDFGKESMGYLVLEDIQGEGLVEIYYGESREEALDKEHCETLDKFEVSGSRFQVPESKAFRFVYIETDVTIGKIAMDYEYLPFDDKKSGSFRCNDEELNRIWEVGAYTMDLTTREFFMDGIKRDRWTWSGDAIQSYLMNYYLRFDLDCVKRTIRQLRGKDPVTAHVNTIMDYTFYWFKSVLDYYLYSGDEAFVQEMYPRMKTLMDYCLGRVNVEGMAEGQPDDWIFVDWVDFPMHKRGVLAFEQILFCKALEIMAMVAPLASSQEGKAESAYYQELADALRKKVKTLFWDEGKKAFLHAIEDGQMNPQITKFPNMFAILYDFVPEEDKEKLMQTVMLNKKIEPITTPYMRFYELAALCQMGYQDEVLPEIKGYWGGMLREGATSFWEKYNPEESGTQHLAMYGRPYGKSLCHAWGASPVYLLGKYFLGVNPTKPGYTEYEIKPTLGGLEWMEGEVPTPFGKICVKMDAHNVTVKSDGGRGILFINGECIEIPARKEIIYTY